MLHQYSRWRETRTRNCESRLNRDYGVYTARMRVRTHAQGPVRKGLIVRGTGCGADNNPRRRPERPGNASLRQADAGATRTAWPCVRPEGAPPVPRAGKVRHRQQLDDVHVACGEVVKLRAHSAARSRSRCGRGRAQSWYRCGRGRAQSRCRCGRGGPAESQCRCGRGGSSLTADVAGVGPVPAQMWQRWAAHPSKPP